MSYLISPIGLSLGFALFKYLSHPDRHNKHIPPIRIGNLSLMPELKINLNQWTIHIHHWIYLSYLLSIIIITTNNLHDLLLLKATISGGIIQGLTYKDRFKILYKETN